MKTNKNVVFFLIIYGLFALNLALMLVGILTDCTYLAFTSGVFLVSTVTELIRAFINLFD